MRNISRPPIKTKTISSVLCPRLPVGGDPREYCVNTNDAEFQWNFLYLVLQQQGLSKSLATHNANNLVPGFHHPHRTGQPECIIPQVIPRREAPIHSSRLGSRGRECLLQSQSHLK